MKKIGIVWRGFLSAAAMGIAMLLLPVAASAHVPADQHRIAVNGLADPVHTDCMQAGTKPAAGYRLNCHLSSAPQLADGATKSRDHDLTIAPAIEVPDFVAPEFRTDFTQATQVRIAAPPRYILFGNFRS